MPFLIYFPSSLGVFASFGPPCIAALRAPDARIPSALSRCTRTSSCQRQGQSDRAHLALVPAQSLAMSSELTNGSLCVSCEPLIRQLCHSCEHT